MPNFNGDVVFVDTSGQVRAQTGDLTLRADSTNARSIIVGSGVSLRPDRDLFINLGREDLRWLKTNTGHLAAQSGVLGPDPSLSQFPYMTWDDAGFAVIGDFPINKTFSFTQLDVVMAQCTLQLGGGTDLTVDGTANFQGGITGSAVLSRAVPSFDSAGNEFASIGAEGLRYDGVYTSSGVFNHLAPPTSGTFIVVEDADLLPIVDARRAIGSLGRRWARVHAASGIFNTIGAPGSGTRIEAAASIVPNRHNIYSLGTTGQRWANLFATSGTIANLDTTSLTASTISTTDLQTDTATVSDLVVNRSLTLDDGDGLNIIQNGSVVWDIQGTSLDFINGSPAFETISASDIQTGTATFSSNVSITGTLSTRNIVPQSDRLYGIGTSALRYARVHAASGVFNTLSPQSSGTYVTSVGSIVPEVDALYSLGTSTLRWGTIYASSGIINNFTVGDTTSVGNINALGGLLVAGLAAFNGGTFFGNAAAPTPDVSFPFGLQGFRWTQIYAASGMIETIDPLPSGGFLTINGSVFPDRDLVRSLGGTARRWATVEAGSGVWTTGATIKGAPVVTNKDARTTVHAVITANSGIIISSNAEVDIYNYTVPANTLSPSGKLQLECIGSMTNMSAAAVNMTPRVYVNGTAIWGDLFSVSAGPRPADFALYADICALGSMTGQRVRGSIELATRTAGSITGNGDFGALNGGQGNWSSVAASGTVDFRNPVNVRVTMQFGTSSTLISYSGFQCIMAHQPFPGV